MIGWNEANANAILRRLNVHVGCSIAQRLRDDLVDDLDDRRVGVDDGLDLFGEKIGGFFTRSERLDVNLDRVQCGIRLTHARPQLRRQAECEPHLELAQA